MTVTKKQAYENAIAADTAWMVELRKLFGRDACNARYEKRGRGLPGSDLAKAYDAWMSAMHDARVRGIVP